MTFASDIGRDGFVVLEKFLDCQDVADIAALADSRLDAPGEMTCARPHNTLAPLRWNDTIVQRILDSRRRIELLRHAVGAGDLKWISGYVSAKEAHSPPLWWHQDWWCWDHPVSYRWAAPQIALLCYLTDTNPNNGALRVLPGSHHTSAPIHAMLPEAHGLAAEGLAPGHAAMTDLADQRTFCLQSGDAVAIDYRLLHSTHGNSSDARRNCILLSFTPSWCGLPDDIKAHLIDHPAQPSAIEAAPASSMLSTLLPAYGGARRSLHLNRHAPATFEAVE